jgi:hypothetical protein
MILDEGREIGPVSFLPLTVDMFSLIRLIRNLSPEQLVLLCEGSLSQRESAAASATLIIIIMHGTYTPLFKDPKWLHKRQTKQKDGDTRRFNRRFISPISEGRGFQEGL